MKENKLKISFIKNFTYAITMGIFEVVPGISGGTLAFLLGIYETLISAISNLRKDFKNSFKILFPSLMGMGVGIYCFSFIISFLHKTYPMEVNFWLTGLIIGIIPSIAFDSFSFFNPGNEKYVTRHTFKFCILSFLLTVGVMIFINYISFNLQDTKEIITNMDFTKAIKFFAVGALAAFCLMLPGCSGSLIMLSFGIYYSVINAIHNFNFFVLMPVGGGILFGLLLGAKIINFCLKNFRPQTFFGIFGLVLGSSISPFLNFLNSCSESLNLSFLLVHGIFSILSLALGFLFSISFSNIVKKNS